MIEDPTPLTVWKGFPRPTQEQIAAFQSVPTGFVADALGGGGAFAPVIRPIGGGRDIRCRAAGPAITAANGPADILATIAALNFVNSGDILIASVDGHQGCSAAGDRVIGMLQNAGGVAFVTDGRSAIMLASLMWGCRSGAAASIPLHPIRLVPVRLD